MAMTMAKKFASCTGMRSYSFPHASPSGMPTACVSMIERNSLLSGSGASLVIMRRLSRRGRPALTPRTTISTASGNAFKNFASRRFFRYFSIQNRQAAAGGEAKPQRGEQSTVEQKADQKADHRQGGTRDKKTLLRPRKACLCDAHVERGGFGAAVFDLLGVASICSRRGFCWLRAVR